MAQEIVKFDVNNQISLQNLKDVKEEFQDEYYPDNKICVFETTISISNTGLNEYMRKDKIKKCEISSVDCIKTELLSSEVNNTVSNNIKIESEISSADIQIEFCNGLLRCNHCHEAYQDYCTKCRMLVHILNKKSHNIFNKIRELPKYMLETRESLGHLGIYTLKVIPKDVRFGPFTGLNYTGLSLRIVRGRFVVNDDQLVHMNWMQYINPARNICEQNLFPFQYEDKLYYCSTRKIQEGEELMVYFGEVYRDNLFKNVEMDFVPIVKEDVENVFACTSCCLGFSSKEYLAEHKIVCQTGIREMFSVKELVQCPYCKIYLDAKEYLQHHVDYCGGTNARHCVFLPTEDNKLQLESRSSVRSKAKMRKRGMYKCTQCKFRTTYNADFRHHTNKHYEMKMYKCGICGRRYKARESLKAHLEKNHPDNEGNDEKYSMCDNFKANIKSMKERSPNSHDGEKQCKFQSRGKCRLKSLLKIKHLNRGKHKCANCEFKTYCRTYLEMHMKMKHLEMETDYKCKECEFKANYQSVLERHLKAKHFKEKIYKCTDCEYQTSYKSCLPRHVKAKHVKVSDYKCAECEYKTNFKARLEMHIKTKHLKQKDYKCAECEYQTNYKENLNIHIKSKHPKHKDYKCGDCEFKTAWRGSLKVHVERKHKKQKDYKCAECEYTTCRKLDLKLHIKTRHLKDSGYNCAYCEYRVWQKSSLKVHMKTRHLKESDYNCADCEYKTCLKSCLQEHIKTKHLKVSDYKCAECEYKTCRKSNLKVHVKSKHLKQYDYKCAECEHQTNYKSKFEVHMKTKHLKQNYINAESVNSRHT